jgi:hypothetical protein
VALRPAAADALPGAPRAQVASSVAEQGAATAAAPAAHTSAVAWDAAPSAALSLAAAGAAAGAAGAPDVAHRRRSSAKPPRVRAQKTCQARSAARRAAVREKIRRYAFCRRSLCLTRAPPAQVPHCGEVPDSSTLRAYNLRYRCGAARACSRARTAARM